MRSARPERFPIVETGWADAPAAIAEIQPVALAIAEPGPAPDPRYKRALLQAIESARRPGHAGARAAHARRANAALPGALPIGLDDPAARLVARLRSALRIRTLHATVLRRARADGAPAVTLPPPYAPDHARRRDRALRRARQFLSGAVGRDRRARRSDRRAERRDRGALSRRPRHRGRRHRRRAWPARGRGAADRAGGG